MKIRLSNFNSGLRAQLAMTLVEMVVTFSILIMMMGGMFALHIFGMKYDQVTTSKLGASDQSRRAFDTILGDIRSAKGIAVGTWRARGAVMSR